MDLRALATAVVIIVLVMVGNQIIGFRVNQMKSRVDRAVATFVSTPPPSIRVIEQLTQHAIMTRSYLEVFFSESSDLMVLLDGNGLIEAVNNSWARLLGYTNSALVGQHWKEFVHPQDIRGITRSYRSGSTLPLEVRVRANNGEWRWIQFASAQVGDHVVSSGRDVTEQRMLREQIVEREILFRSLLDLVPLPSSVADEDGRYIHANPAFLNFLGYTGDELAHLTVFDITPQEELASLLRATEEVRSGRHPRVKWTQTFIRRDGARRRCEVLAHGVRIGGHYRFGVSILNAADADGIVG